MSTSEGGTRTDKTVCYMEYIFNLFPQVYFIENLHTAKNTFFYFSLQPLNNYFADVNKLSVSMKNSIDFCILKTKTAQVVVYKRGLWYRSVAHLKQ